MLDGIGFGGVHTELIDFYGGLRCAEPIVYAIGARTQLYSRGSVQTSVVRGSCMLVLTNKHVRFVSRCRVRFADRPTRGHCTTAHACRRRLRFCTG